METADPTEVRLRRLCGALSSRNRSATQIHFGPPISNTRLYALGQAVTGNPYVSSIELNVSVLRDNDDRVASLAPPASAPRVRLFERFRVVAAVTETEKNDLMNPSQPKSLALFLNHMATSPALQSVALDGWNTQTLHHVPLVVASYFVTAIAANPSIHTLHLINLQIPPHKEIFATLTAMFQVASLDPTTAGETVKRPHQFRRLTIRGCDFYNDAASETLAQLVGEHVSLESLSLQSKCGSLLTERILWRLTPVVSRSCMGLQELSLDSQYNELRVSHMASLSYVVRTCTTLKRLTLWYYDFVDATLFQLLVDALVSTRSGATTAAPLQRLSLKKCRFDVQSSRLFTEQFLMPGHCPFRELHLVDENTFEHETKFSHRTAFGKFLFAPMLSVSPPSPAVNMASSPNAPLTLDGVDSTTSAGWDDAQRVTMYLNFLNLQSVRDQRTFSALCHDLAGTTTRHGIRLRRFHFGYLRHDSATTLIECLPNMVYLKEIYIALIDDRLDSNGYWKYKLLRAIRRNGSLERVVLYTGPDTHRSRLLFSTEIQQRRLMAYGERNRNLPRLLQQPTGGDHVLELMPALLDVAKHAPQMSPTHLLTGLLAAEDSLTGWREW